MTQTKKTIRSPIIGVMGGATVKPSVRDLAYRLGALIASRGWILLNGGRNVGVMAASAAGAKEAGGTVIGILPDKTDAKASKHLDVAILTGLGDARNLINVLSSDVVIALRGSLGTQTEIILALKHKKPVILLGREIPPDLRKYERSGQLATANTSADAVNAIAAILADTKR